MFPARTMKAFLSFLRREFVFCAAAVCALASAFFVPPSRAYLSYIDWDTLHILFALMGVIGALRSCGVFDALARALCGRVRSVRALSAVLVLLCFFSSMLITNDVALLTFVPFSLALLGGCAGGKTVLFTVVLETLAANTGSMLTPLGNPQNLFLFSKMNLGISEFMRLIAPYSFASLALLCAALCLVPRSRIKGMQGAAAQKRSAGTMLREAVYSVLFVLCLLSVVRIVPKWVSALAVLVALLALDQKVLRSVDCMLLLTFAAFFIFTGNIASIPAVRGILQEAMGGNEFALSVAASQVISNVPATLLLFPFSTDTESLLIGVNAGGLGTLVASLASLISFKLYASAQKRLSLPSNARYLAVFTAANALVLAAMCALRMVIISAFCNT